MASCFGEKWVHQLVPPICWDFFADWGPLLNIALLSCSYFPHIFVSCLAMMGVAICSMAAHPPLDFSIQLRAHKTHSFWLLCG